MEILKIMKNIETGLDASVRTKIWSLHNFINESKQIHWTPENSSANTIMEDYSIIGDEIGEIFHSALGLELERKYFDEYSNALFSETVNKVVKGELSNRNISEESNPEELSPEDAEEIDEIIAVAKIAEENGVEFGAWENFDLGNAALVRGSTEEAERSFNEGLRIFQEEGDKEGIIASHNCLAALAIRTGDLDEARYNWNKISNLSKEDGFEVDKGVHQNFSTINGLGSVSYHRGKLRSAESMFSKALEVAINLDDPFLESIALLNLGSTNLNLGRPDTAREMKLQSLEKLKENMTELGETYDENSLKLHESDVLRGLAQAEETYGNVSKAASLHEESLGLQREFGDRYREAGSLTNLGNLAVRNGRYTEAQELMESALEIMEDVGPGKDCGNIDESREYCSE